MTEKILEVLRGNPAGVSSASHTPLVPQLALTTLFTVDDFKNLTSYPAHRINESLTALVRAKITLKVLAKVGPSPEVGKLSAILYS